MFVQVALRKVQPSAKREGFVTVPDVTWDDIGALADVRSELQMAILVSHSRSTHPYTIRSQLDGGYLNIHSGRVWVNCHMKVSSGKFSHSRANLVIFSILMPQNVVCVKNIKQTTLFRHQITEYITFAWI